MGWINIAIDFLLFLFVIDCVLMCLVVLMQRSKQEGLGAAFGGSMMSDTFGAQTSQVLVKATVWLAATFFILSILLAHLYSQKATMKEKGSPLQQELMQTVAPATKPAADATTSTPAAANAAPATSAPAAAMAPATTNAVVPASPAKPTGK